MKTVLSVVTTGLLAAILAVPPTAGQETTGSIVITEDGVGQINATTPFSIPAIARLFPGLRVVAGVDATEGMEFPTIEVIDIRGVLLEIVPVPDQSIIHSVITKRKEVANSRRGQIGSLYSQIFGETLSKACFPGREEMSDDLICKAPESDSIYLVFGGLDDGSPATLKKMRITEIYWIPQAGLK